MKPIPGFPSYQITRDGRVWSEPKHYHQGRWLKPEKCHRGHLRIRLNGIRKLIHRLVLETYIGPCPDGMECRHLNGDPQNNRLENLCWGTRSENQKDSIQHGTARCLSQNGEEHRGVKLTETKVKLIRYLYSLKMFTLADLAWQFDVAESTIHGIIKRRRWKHI